MQVLCIAGFSSVGKKTVICRLLGRDADLCRRFGVVGATVAVGYAFGALDRDRLAGADTVLIQWQCREHAALATLREWFPTAEHRTYFLLREWVPHTRSQRERYGNGWTIPMVQDFTFRLLRHYFADGPIEVVAMPEFEPDRLPEQVG